MLYDQHGTELVAAARASGARRRGTRSATASTPSRPRCTRSSTYVDAGGVAVGAFTGGRLVGIGVVVPHLRPGIAQLAYLHVTAASWSTGVGRRLSEQLDEIARAAGDSAMVVTATPSEHTVRFYLGRGFRPMSDPLAELFALRAGRRAHAQGALSIPGLATTMAVHVPASSLGSCASAGFTVIEGFLAADELAAAQDALWQEFPRPADYFADPSRYERLTRTQFAGLKVGPWRSWDLNRLAFHPDLVDLAARFLGSTDLRLYKTELWAKYAGAVDYDQPHHRDFGNHTLVVPDRTSYGDVDDDVPPAVRCHRGRWPDDGRAVRGRGVDPVLAAEAGDGRTSPTSRSR